MYTSSLFNDAYKNFLIDLTIKRQSKTFYNIPRPLEGIVTLEPRKGKNYKGTVALAIIIFSQKPFFFIKNTTVRGLRLKIKKHFLKELLFFLFFSNNNTRSLYKNSQVNHGIKETFDLSNFFYSKDLVPLLFTEDPTCKIYIKTSAPKNRRYRNKLKR